MAMVAKPAVLVVDDDKLILTILSDILRRDYDVHTANDGASALIATSNTNPCSLRSIHL
jgi:CheY-like chemotaxis protein